MVRVRSRVAVSFGVVLCALLAALGSVHAATLACETRASCLNNQTRLLYLNSSESGQAPNNSHAQLANYSGVAYPYSVCCWTDSFRTLNNTCGGNGIAIVRLNETNNSHVEAGNMSTATYPYLACLNVTAGNITCSYDNTPCAAGYTSLLSIASSEADTGNLTNAHVSAAGHYLRQACCQIGGLNPPSVAYANLTPINTSKRLGLTCENGSVTDTDGDTVTLHYNWFRNGTSITALNLPMDYPNGTHTNDISGSRNHGALNNVTFLPTGGAIGGTYRFNGRSSACCVIPTSSSVITVPSNSVFDFATGKNFSIGFWLSTRNNNQAQGIMSREDDDASAGWSLYLSKAASSKKLDFGFGGSGAQSTGTILRNDTWYYIVITQNSTHTVFYINGTSAGSSSAVNFDALAATSLNLGRVAVPNGGFDYYYELNGSLDEVMFFNRTLTPNEILTLYTSYGKRLNQSEMEKGNLWNCSITPVDSTGLNGSTVYSNQSKVNASPPLPVNLTYPANNNQSVFERYVNFSWSTPDEPDGDTVNYTLSVLVTPGSCSVQSTLTNLQTTNRTIGELCVDQIYNWTVEACDIDGCSGNTTTFNFTIASVIGLVLRVNGTAFGSMAVGRTNATDGPGGPNPFILENNGNVFVNVTLNASASPFTSVALGDAAFQFRVADNETNSINTSGSATAYTTVPSGPIHAIKQLNYTDRNDSAKIHINITVPANEPPGYKETNLTFRGTLTSA